MQIPVSSSSTVKSIKLHIYEKLHFSPTEQKLVYKIRPDEEVELEEGDKTLREYSVPRDAVLVLHILTADGSEDMSGRGKGEGDAGFSGTLLSGFTPADDCALVVTGVSKSQDHSSAALGGQQNICETDVGAANGQGEKKARREDKKAGRKREPEAVHISVLTEEPKTTKRERKKPAEVDLSAHVGTTSGKQGQRGNTQGAQGARSRGKRKGSSDAPNEEPEEDDEVMRKVLVSSLKDAYPSHPLTVDLTVDSH